MNVTLTPALEEDYARILELNEAALPHVNRIDIAELADLHAEALSISVVRPESSQEILAFVIVLGPGAAYASPNYRYFADRFDRFAYVDRVVVDDRQRGLGIGRKLYEELFAAHRAAQRVTCEVNLTPPNPGSLAFHESLGFEKLGEQDTEGGAKRVALLVREL